MQPEEEPDELIAARNKLNSASLTQQENEPAGKPESCVVASCPCAVWLCVWCSSLAFSVSVSGRMELTNRCLLLVAMAIVEYRICQLAKFMHMFAYPVSTWVH